MHQGDLKCIFLCNEEESQNHIFKNCQLRLNISKTINLDYVYGNFGGRLETIQI